MLNHQITLGFAPNRRPGFDPAPACANKKAIHKKLKALAKENRIKLVDLDWLNGEGVISETADVPRVVERFRQEKVDAVFTAHCNFGSEEAVGKIGRGLGKPLLLWGPRDEAPLPGKIRVVDTQCGIFASSKVLQRMGVPFTYIENCRIDDEVFAREFQDFIRASSVVKAFRGLRIGQVNLRPAPFLSVMANESELMEKFGIEVVPVTAHEVIRRMNEIAEKRSADVQALMDETREKTDCSAVKQEQLEQLAAMELALSGIAVSLGLDALACECWSVFMKALRLVPCAVLGNLTDKGIPVVCETDVNGAIASALLTAAARGETPTFFADLTVRHPENDQAELLWHCGPFPRSLAKPEARPKLTNCAGQWELKGGDVTIARFDGLKGEYFLFADQARGVSGPETTGTYLWVEVDDWARWEKKFIYGPYIHHVACVHGKYARVLHEACKYLGDVQPDNAGKTCKRGELLWT